MTRFFLSLGSNLEPEAHLRVALRELRARFGALDVSPVYESAAVGFDGPPFWNLVVGLDSDLDAKALNAWLHELENSQGRRRDTPRYADRTLDLDIVAINGRATDRPELQHAFVLVPLAEIAPEIVEPRSGLTVGELRSQVANASLRKLDVRVDGE
ncbi:MAG TPA: 2-amino-4-hydroxy-6-hydroxymethyldihydropteridine diphosphokinase [Rhodanobacteraceae bacterium]|nr:2-amino-4-hydroxy-6-hydroxymethyldihydropteridine diphosphokinase [Rhodanobacteraceae bacterium]